MEASWLEWREKRVGQNEVRERWMDGDHVGQWFLKYRFQDHQHQLSLV